jgi:hypothetical protein
MMDRTLEDCEIHTLPVLAYDAGPVVHINGAIIDEASRAKDDSHHYTIVWKGHESWAVMDGERFSLSKDEYAFTYEPHPSNRDDEYLKATRFRSPGQALRYLKRWKADELARVQALGYETMTERWAKLSPPSSS